MGRAEHVALGKIDTGHGRSEKSSGENRKTTGARNRLGHLSAPLASIISLPLTAAGTAAASPVWLKRVQLELG